MLPHSWILEYLKDKEVYDEIRKLVERAMKFWSVELTWAQETLRKLNHAWDISEIPYPLFVYDTYTLRHGKRAYIFSGSGEKISHFLYMDGLSCTAKTRELDSLIQTVRMFSQDIRMKFGVDKCVIEVERKRDEIIEKIRSTLE